jgi:hypothetical protein
MIWGNMGVIGIRDMDIRPLVIASLFIVLVVSGCASDGGGGAGIIDISGLSSEVLAERVAEANTNIDSYRFDTSGSFSMGFAMMGESVATEMNTTMKGYVDNLNERMYLDTDTVAGGADGRKEELNVKIVVVDGYAYSITEQGSFKQNLSTPWNQQDVMNVSMMMLKNSEITFEGQDSFGGNDYWIIGLKPDLNSFLNSSSGISGTGGQGTAEMTDEMKEAIDKYEMKMWLNKRTLVMEKIALSFDMSAEGFIMRMAMEGYMRDINKPVPEELFEVDVNATEITGDIDDFVQSGGTGTSGSGAGDSDGGTDAVIQTEGTNIVIEGDFDRPLITENCGGLDEP